MIQSHLPAVSDDQIHSEVVEDVVIDQFSRYDSKDLLCSTLESGLRECDQSLSRQSCDLVLHPAWLIRSTQSLYIVRQFLSSFCHIRKNSNSPILHARANVLGSD